MFQSSGEAVPQAIASVIVTMMADGSIHTQANVPSRNIMFMMLETAKFELDHQLRQAQSKPQLALPHPGMIVPRT